MSKQDITMLDPQELHVQMKALSEPDFRAGQLLQWIERGAMSFDEMTNLPAPLRARLAEQYSIASVKAVRRLVSEDGTVKYLNEIEGQESVESVVMKYSYGHTICISTQAGCRMGCSFCATGIQGLKRNLTPHEMLGQIIVAERDLSARMTHLVLMGMGEPLDNYENVLAFLRRVTSPTGMNLGMRKITLSTCGVVDKIYRLMEENMPITLSVSLHAPEDALRSSIMPVGRKWSIHELLEACRAYIKYTGRRVSFEYSLIERVNDSDRHAEKLAQLLKGMLCHVNLIPVNAVEGSSLRGSSRKQVARFREVLAQHTINATIRRTLGADIAASCGQLRGSVG